MLPPLKALRGAAENGTNPAESSWLTVLILSFCLLRWCDLLRALQIEEQDVSIV